MPLNQMLPGNFVYAQDVLDELAARTPLWAYKPVDTPRVTNIVMATDPDLLVTVPANSKWSVTLIGPYNANFNCDIKFGWTGPAGATLTNWLGRWRAMDSAEVSGCFANIAAIATNTAASGTIDQGFNAWGTLIVGGTPGTFGFQWAQATSHASAAVMKAGAQLLLTPML